MKFRQLIYLFGDLIIVVIAFYLAALLRYDGQIPQEAVTSIFAAISISMFGVVFFSIILGCYSSLWMYIGFESVFKQVLVCVLTVCALLIIKYATPLTVSGSISVMFGVLLFLMTTGIRSTARFMRWVNAMKLKNSSEMRRVVIIGAGNTGAMVIKRLTEYIDEKLTPVAIVDDDYKKIGLKIYGVLVVGELSEVDKICKSYKADEIIIAIPSATKDELSEIYLKCAKTKLPIKMFQNVIEIDEYLNGNQISLKEITLEDLLSRDAYKADMHIAKRFIKGKTVMVTGGAGSIGSELCRQILEYGCELLVIFDINENGLFELNEELKQIYPTDLYKLCVGSIRDFKRLEMVMSDYNPSIVYHAAAHKHVPMMEINPFEAIKNNVLGTINVINCCIQNDVSKFVLISSDKAVNTPNIMGATKRIAELIVANTDGKGCELSAVRFGNVLGSVGSVIPTFKKQIEAGGPVTVTHKDIKRYFMTIPEAVRLLLLAGALAKGEEIFVLDMGVPIKIYDLACDLIKMSGLEPNVDIEIKITGLRAGEKLTEELFFDYETVDKTLHEKISVVKSKINDEKSFMADLNNIIEIAKSEEDEEELRNAVFSLINK